MSHPGPTWTSGIDFILGRYGFVLTISLRYTATNAAVPTAREVTPWVAIVERLWDDPVFEHRHRELAIRESRRWGADLLVERYEGFFHSFRARLAAPNAGPGGYGTRLSRGLPSAR